MARAVSLSKPLAVDTVVKLPTKDSNQELNLDLRVLESSHRVIMLYLWLRYVTQAIGLFFLCSPLGAAINEIKERGDHSPFYIFVIHCTCTLTYLRNGSVWCFVERPLVVVVNTTPDLEQQQGLTITLLFFLAS
jgi:hypothetical protein